jgi:hypothetical protein
LAGKGGPERRLLAGTAIALLVGAAPLAAQYPQCQPYVGQTNALNLCNAVIDGARGFHPILGLLTSGGAPVLGASDALGGFGHVYVTVRVNATRVVLPDLNYDGSTTTVGAGDKLFFPSPVIETAVGLFSGTRTGLLALDFLGSAQLLPTNQIDNFSVASTARHIGSVALGLGFGARLGVIRETAALPGVTVSVMRRDIPELRYGDLGAGANLSSATNLKATNVRAVATKGFGIARVGGGLGWDRYTGHAQVQFRNPTTAIPEPALDLDLANSRILGFANAGLDFRHVKLTAEAGYQFGKDQHLVTTFTDFDPSGGRFFAAVGLTVGL